VDEAVGGGVGGLVGEGKCGAWGLGS